MLDAQYPISDAADEAQPVLTLDCRGLEPVEAQVAVGLLPPCQKVPHQKKQSGWRVTSESASWDGVDLSEGEWADYDGMWQQREHDGGQPCNRESRRACDN